ncbi:uncharacterized protein LOC135945088 [Cloeon dipterum]|uniref:uncharacterized protein LOC135945088 n=1 Tax=Cloeon dipterum TaxID=197152 RepID=UPI00321FAF26
MQHREFRAFLIISIWISKFIYTSAQTTKEVCYIKDMTKEEDLYWREKASEHKCFRKCQNLFSSDLDLDSISLKPEFREPVFERPQELVNCFRMARKVTTICRYKTNGIPLQQYGDLPLVHFASDAVPRFQAEKFCKWRGLNFDLEQVKNIQLNVDRIWAPNLQYSDSNLTCFVFVRKFGTFVMEQDNCRNKNAFLCTLPEACHTTSCISNSQQLKSQKATCYPRCRKPDCNEESSCIKKTIKNIQLRLTVCALKLVVEDMSCQKRR